MFGPEGEFHGKVSRGDGAKRTQMKKRVNVKITKLGKLVFFLVEKPNPFAARGFMSSSFAFMINQFDNLGRLLSSDFLGQFHRMSDDPKLGGFRNFRNQRGERGDEIDVNGLTESQDRGF